MTIKIAINGFGRIGRLVTRALYEYKKQYDGIELVGINTRGNTEQCAHLLKYDSAHGIFSEKVTFDDKHLFIGKDQKNKILCTSEIDPSNAPWKKIGVDIVMECSGKFKTGQDAAKHIEAGAKKVIISAPGKSIDATIVVGVNDHRLKSSDQIISNASCTTNCLAPVAKILEEKIGIKKGFMTTIHAYTGDQNLVDMSHKDLRRARAGAQNIIPTSTGAAQAVGLVLPSLEGKLIGSAIRIPVQNVSLVDLSFEAARTTNAEEINQFMKEASQNELKNILAYNEAPLVSSDFNHHPASSIFDATGTYVTDKNFARILAWYDNEWGFSCRMIELAQKIGAFL